MAGTTRLELCDLCRDSERLISIFKHLQERGRHRSIDETDLALRRRFSLTDSVKLDVRAEYFNVFNHPMFVCVETRHRIVGYTVFRAGF